ncbi:MAG: DNA mismatch repair protein MutS, partial [Clostridia bacterium]|nr:DNA mismatch repair protein MutS [Clostridia bacterium]
MAKLSPMMEQYFTIKEQYSDAILFFRLGDFYEMFYDDAVTASRELELTLTGKDCGQEERAPMCGVPFHAADQYIDRLIEKGYKVAICEQTEDPSKAKGLVRRDVIRVVTAGTVTNSKTIDEKTNNYLCSVYKSGDYVGLAFVDVTTGDLYVTECDYDVNSVLSDLSAYNTKEIVCNTEFGECKDIINEISAKLYCNTEVLTDKYYNETFAKDIVIAQFKKTADDLGLGGNLLALIALGGLLQYLNLTQMCALPHINKVEYYSSGKYMELDFATRRNLELVSTMRENKRRGSLLWVLDDTKTSMGARLMVQWLEKPLVNPIMINKRLYSVKELVDNPMMRDDIGAVLSGIYDISRIVTRISSNTLTPKDMVSLRDSLIKLPELDYLLSQTKSPVLSELSKNMDILEDLRVLLENSIDNEAS